MFKNPLTFLAAALGLSAPLKREMDLPINRWSTGRVLSPKQRRARAAASRAKVARRDQRRLARERGLNRSHP